MAFRTWKSRPIRHLAGPTLLAVMAILAGSSVMSGGGASPRLAVTAVAAASLAVFGDDVSGIVHAQAAKESEAQVAMDIDEAVDARMERSRISLHHLVLPPPAA